MYLTLRGIPIGVWSEATTLDKVCATAGAAVNLRKISFGATLRYVPNPQLQLCYADKSRSGAQENIGWPVQCVTT